MIDAPPEENVGAGPAVVLAVLLTSFFNHRWTQINTDIGICIRVYLPRASFSYCPRASDFGLLGTQRRDERRDIKKVYCSILVEVGFVLKVNSC